MSILGFEEEILEAIEALSEEERIRQAQEIEERFNMRYSKLSKAKRKGKGNVKEQSRRYRLRKKLEAQGLTDNDDLFTLSGLSKEQADEIEALNKLIADEKKAAEMEWRCKPRKPVRVLAIKLPNKS